MPPTRKHSDPLDEDLDEQRAEAAKARRANRGATKISPQHQAKLPAYGTPLGERPEPTLISLNDVVAAPHTALVAHKFFERASCMLFGRIKAFLKRYPDVTEEAERNLQEDGLTGYVRSVKVKDPEDRRRWIRKWVITHRGGTTSVD